MNGYDIGRAVGAQIVGLILIAFSVGGLLALSGYFAISWLISHVSISFS